MDALRATTLIAQLPTARTRLLDNLGRIRRDVGPITQELSDALADHMNIRLDKAVRSRWLGRRPHVRGVAMNPVDHPMGGGEGRTSGGRHPVSPTGVPAKGGKTRRRRKPSNKSIIRRRKSVRYGQLKI